MREPKDLSPVKRAGQLSRGPYILLGYLVVITILAIIFFVGWLNRGQEIQQLHGEIERLKLCTLDVVDCN